MCRICRIAKYFKSGWHGNIGPSTLASTAHTWAAMDPVEKHTQESVPDQPSSSGANAAMIGQMTRKSEQQPPSQKEEASGV